MFSTLLNGFVLGWSVAWPPGPVNSEMIRRGLLPKEQGGGFWAAWRVGLGACTGDFLWALTAAAGAGALLNRPTVRTVLGLISFVLLLVLAALFSISAWKTAQKQRRDEEKSLAEQINVTKRRGSRGYLLGFLFAVSSPWNIGFWMAVVGSQQSVARSPSFLSSLTLAGAVVLGAVTWTIVLCAAVRSGAKIFAAPVWQVWTQALTAVVMLYFAVKLALQFLA
jgi:threonine/homoserine/homoserine lactone efflux protein